MTSYPSWTAVNEDGSLKTRINCKPTHADQLMNWDSIHHLERKRSVVCILLRRMETVVSKPADKRGDEICQEISDNKWINKSAFQIHQKREKGEMMHLKTDSFPGFQ